MAIPITNGEAFIAAPLTDGVDCLDFQDADGLLLVIELALAMDEREKKRMRRAVLNYYERFLDPKAFVERFFGTNSNRIFVNAEENSVPLAYTEFKMVW